MLGFFRRQPQKAYTVLARHRTGHWFRRFVVKGASAYEAARTFDQGEDNQYWTRVSGATLYDEV